MSEVVRNEKNPLVSLSFETLSSLRGIHEAMLVGQEKKDLETDHRVRAAEILLAGLDTAHRLPSSFDREGYIHCVRELVKLEDEISKNELLPRTNPSAAIEVAGLLARGHSEQAKQLAALRDQINEYDRALENCLGIHPHRALEIVRHDDFKLFDQNRVSDAAKERSKYLSDQCKKYNKQNAAWVLENGFSGKDSGFSSVTKQMLHELDGGILQRDELAEQPPRGEFEYLVDTKPEQKTIPVVCYQGQIIKTSRNVVSPDFSSCAGVLIYKESAAHDTSDGNEIIFAHLPPRTFPQLGQASHFKDYTPEFFKKQLGLDSLDGFGVRIITGLKVPPIELAQALSKLGAKIEKAEQLPRDMYTIFVDSKTKSMAIKGLLERMPFDGESPTYRTEEGIGIVQEKEMTGVAFVE